MKKIKDIEKYKLYAPKYGLRELKKKKKEEREKGEKVQKIFEKIKIMPNSTDAILIKSALEGEFRTSTGQRHRGKGLPSIYDNVRQKYFSNLRIISNYAYINCIKNKYENIENKFYGTLYKWDFKKEQGDNNE